MQKLMWFARPNDTIVVWRIDCLGHSVRDVVTTIASFRARGINVQSLSDGIDSSTTNGQILLNLLSSLAEYEHELISERVTAGIAVARSSGVSLGRPPSDPKLNEGKLRAALNARANGKSAPAAAQLVGWMEPPSTATQQALRLTIKSLRGVVRRLISLGI
jgi:DNA invertase Pin-like site-specific DNA recombinase